MNNQNNLQLITLLIKNKEITLLRKKYDPSYNKKFRNHLNLVYSFSGINKKVLYNHIKKSIEGIKPFKVTFNKFWKFKNNKYIYIISDNGLNKFMNLYKKLNSGILSNFKNKDIPKHMPRYIPHVTLTYLDSIKETNNLFSQLKREKINFEVKIDSVQLITLNKNNLIKSVKNFKLR